MDRAANQLENPVDPIRSSRPSPGNIQFPACRRVSIVRIPVPFNAMSRLVS